MTKIQKEFESFRVYKAEWDAEGTCEGKIQAFKRHLGRIGRLEAHDQAIAETERLEQIRRAERRAHGCAR